MLLGVNQERNIATSARWREAIQEVDGATFQQLRTGIQGGFDEVCRSHHMLCDAVSRSIGAYNMC